MRRIGVEPPSVDPTTIPSVRVEKSPDVSEVANAIFEYLEIFHNRQRRHSSLGMLSPIEYERHHADNPARDQAS
jgi:transposase InsO family protein